MNTNSQQTVALNYWKQWKRRRSRKKMLGIESSIWRSFMKTESTTQKPTVNKSPIFQSCIIFIAAYFLVIRIIYTLAFLFCFRLVFSFDFLSVFFFLYIIFSICMCASRVAISIVCFSMVFRNKKWKEKKNTHQKFQCVFHQFSGDATVSGGPKLPYSSWTINKTRK